MSTPWMSLMVRTEPTSTSTTRSSSTKSYARAARSCGPFHHAAAPLADGVGPVA
jgi:hypothetical protein